jgi:hypothetical protein
MNQLATAVRGDPVDNVGGVAVSAPVVPVFVDATGRRRKVVTGFGWLVALACVAYLGVIGVSMTGTSVGPLPDLPSVASRAVVFGSEADGLPQGALEGPLPVLAPPVAAAPQAAAAPNFANSANSAKVAARGGTAPKTAPKLAPKLAPKTAPKTASKTAPKKAPTVNRTTSSVRIGGASR